eukprot:767566-Hanusia_phi.AAC.7
MRRARACESIWRSPALPLTSSQSSDPNSRSRPKDMLLHPVMGSKHRVLAIIQLVPKERAVAEEERELVESFAVTLSAALELCSRSSAVSRRCSRCCSLTVGAQEPGDLLSLPIDVSDQLLLSQMQRRVRDKLGCRTVRVFKFDPSCKDLVCLSKDAGSPWRRVSCHKGIVGQTFQTGAMTSSDDPLALPHFHADSDSPSSQDVATSRALEPLTDSRRSRRCCARRCWTELGTGSGSFLRSTRGGRRRLLTASRDEKWLRSVSADFAELLENKRKFEELKSRGRANSVILAASRRLSDVVTKREFVEEVRKHAMQLLDCSACSCFLVDHDGDRFFTVDASGNDCHVPNSPDTVIGHATRAQQLIRVADLRKDSRFAGRGREEELVRMLCCPVVGDGRVSAVIQ